MKCEQEDNRMEQDAKVERLLEMLRRAAEQLPEEESENAKRILSKKLLRKKLKTEAIPI